MRTVARAIAVAGEAGHHTIDAPCRGGTIRRNPDIRLLLTEEALMAQQTLQRQLLQNLWQRLVLGTSVLHMLRFF